MIRREKKNGALGKEAKQLSQQMGGLLRSCDAAKEMLAARLFLAGVGARAAEAGSCM
jgi:hypothetical protein